ncbi:MAG: hypothetical protein Q7U02_09505, partial [Desulfosalsimonadaceae bacterium]|nr:hypothetical protein [Desulfosalsimonadaceae bacterium]
MIENRLLEIASVEIRLYLASLAIAMLVGLFFTAIDFGGCLPNDFALCLGTGFLMYFAVIIAFYWFRPVGAFKPVVVALTALTTGAIVGLLFFASAGFCLQPLNESESRSAVAASGISLAVDDATIYLGSDSFRFTTCHNRNLFGNAIPEGYLHFDHP